MTQNNTFAWALYQQLKTTPQNLFFSPYSLSTAFAMTYVGARGNTAKQMAQTLCFSKTGTDLHAEFALLAEQIKKKEAPPKLLLEIANALWPAQQLSLLPEFLDLTKKYYGAAIFPLNYADTQAASDKINRWAEEKTHHKIKNLVSPRAINTETQLILTNAIYFKGSWKIAFDSKETRKLPFWVSPEQSIQVPMMCKNNKGFRLMENQDLQMLELPYEGESFSMLILLPRSKKNWNSFETSLTSENLNSWKKQLKHQVLPILIPKFKLSTEFSLGSLLEKMGMGDAFCPKKADFSGIDGKRNLFLAAAFHKAFVEVNEEGTEAAAATAIMVGAGGPPKTFMADHPFVFLIQDNDSGTILFVGRILDPTL